MSQTHYCGNCGAAVPPANAFCGSCGANQRVYVVAPNRAAPAAPAPSKPWSSAQKIALVCIVVVGVIGIMAAAVFQDQTKRRAVKPAQAAAEPSGGCPAVEQFIGTPEGGDLVKGVTVKRDGNGYVRTEWQTTFPAGTKSMIMLGRWEPNPRKGITAGPEVAGTGNEETTSDGKLITQNREFSDHGGSIGDGKYYATLTVIDNPVWKQPAAVKALLGDAKGKVKAVSDDAPGGRSFGTNFEVIARFDLPACAAKPSTMPRPAEALAKAKQLTAADASKEQLFEAQNLLRSIPEKAKEHREAKALLDKTIKRSSRMMAEDLVLGPKPDNAGWNGKVFCVDHYLKQTLNDYDSSEYLEWSPVVRTELKGEPYWAVKLKLRAKNAFGAYIVKDVVFFIRRNQVVQAVGI